MAQSLFEVVKRSVTTKVAAEQYGIEVNRSGMVKCPFHSDQSPSLKLNDNYYYCFGCGATGDIIEFVARLFQIGNKEAAEKIAADFGLQYDSHVPYSLPKRTATAVQIQKQRERYTYGVLAHYHRQLQEWLELYSPTNPEQEIAPRYAEAIHRKDYVEYLMDIFLSGSQEERTAFFDFWDKKRPSTFRTLRPVNGLIFGIYFSKLAGGEQHFMLFADGKSTRDRRTSVARECSSLDGTK